MYILSLLVDMDYHTSAKKFKEAHHPYNVGSPNEKESRNPNPNPKRQTERSITNTQNRSRLKIVIAMLSFSSGCQFVPPRWG
jgi:hypothetical protein